MIHILAGIASLAIGPTRGLAPPTFSEFGMYYFIFGLFVALGFTMLGVILLADTDPQYDVDSLKDVPVGEVIPELKPEKKS